MIAWFTVAALAAYTFVGPVVIRGGERALNDPAKVKLPLDETTLQQMQHPAGRRAQEVGEWRLISLPGIICACAFAWYFTGPASAIGAAVAYFVGKLPFYEWTKIGRLIDTAGHGVEIMIAETDGQAGYREAEIERMLRDPKRKGMTAQQVSNQLDGLAWLSRIIRRLAW